MYNTYNKHYFSNTKTATAVMNFCMLRVLLLIVTLIASHGAFAHSFGYNNNRIAVTADGNTEADPGVEYPTGDPDDWGATAASLAIIAKLGLQDKVVHYSYNDFIGAPAGPDHLNQMKISADGGVSRWNFDKTKFFDITTDLSQARTNLAKEMAKSSEDDPLYVIFGGLAEFIYQAVDEVVKQGKVKSLSHVYMVSHSGFNESYLRRPNHHTWSEALALSENRINYKKIPDQNDCKSSLNLWCTNSDFSVWYWMRDHKDPNIQWLYERTEAHSGNKADISDAGMLFYLLQGDASGNPEKFRKFIGDGIKLK